MTAFLAASVISAHITAKFRCQAVWTVAECLQYLAWKAFEMAVVEPQFSNGRYAAIILFQAIHDYLMAIASASLKTNGLTE